MERVKLHLLFCASLTFIYMLIDHGDEETGVHDLTARKKTMVM